jgi:S1-C subfamily serine protease
VIRFHQTFGAHTGRSLDFDKDMVSFGRMPDCDVSFDPHADLDASGRHAEVRREGGRWHVVDVGSRNGTWLNGQRIQRAVLSSGDEIEFGMGGPRVRVEFAPAVQPASSGRDITGPMTPAPGWAQPGAMTGAATPVPDVNDTPIDGTAPTIAAMATPIPGGLTPSGPGSPVTNPPPRHDAPSPIVPPTPPPGGSPKQYGERTVGLMIQAALAQAQQSQPQSKSTAEIHAIAVDAAQKQSRGLKIVVALLALLLVLAVVAIVVIVVVKPRFGAGTTALEPDVQPEEPAAPRIARDFGASVYVLVEQREGVERGICSAFAVRADLLATNAHCVLAMQEGHATGAAHVAVPNGGQGQRFGIVQMWHHPEYVTTADRPSADVGLVQIAGTATVLAPLASMPELAEVAQGMHIYVLGFPGDLSNVGAPVATIGESVIASVTAFDGTPAPFETAQLIHHEAATGPGTSGSPVFDARGRVIAINAGTFRAPTQQEVVGPNGPSAQTVVADTGVKYAVRADLIASLLAGMPR